MTAESIDTKATVTLEQVGGGFSVTSSHLETTVKIPNADKAAFQKAVETAKTGCPISKLLNANDHDERDAGLTSADQRNQTAARTTAVRLHVNVGGNVMDVGVQQRDRLSLLVHVDRHRIAKRDDAGQAALVEHDQVPDARLLHPREAHLVRLVDVRHDQLSGHDVGHRRLRRIATRRHDAGQQITLGEDSHQPVSIDDRNGTDLMFGHRS